MCPCRRLFWVNAFLIYANENLCFILIFSSVSLLTVVVLTSIPIALCTSGLLLSSTVHMIPSPVTGAQNAPTFSTTTTCSQVPPYGPGKNVTGVYTPNSRIAGHRAWTGLIQILKSLCTRWWTGLPQSSLSIVPVVSAPSPGSLQNFPPSCN